MPTTVDLERILGWLTFGAFLVDFVMGVYACVTAATRKDYHTPLVFHVSDARGGAKLVSLPSEWNLGFVLGGAHLVGASSKLVVSIFFFLRRETTRTKKSDDITSFDDIAAVTGGVRSDHRSWSAFVASVATTTNFWRWTEWAVCGPMFALAASLCCGSRDLHFILSQMVVAVSVVVLAFEQERKIDGAIVSWTPAIVAAGLFACHWILVFWQAHASSVGTAVSTIPAILMTVGVALGFVAQTYASRGYRDGRGNLARVIDWLIAGGKKGGGGGGKKYREKNETGDAIEVGETNETKKKERDRALFVEIVWTGVVALGKVVFTLVALEAVVPDLLA